MSLSSFMSLSEACTDPDTAPWNTECALYRAAEAGGSSFLVQEPEINITMRLFTWITT